MITERRKSGLLLTSIRQHAKAAIGAGIGLVILGALSIAAPFAAAMTAVALIGSLLLIGGFIHGFLAFLVGHPGRALYQLLFAALLAMTGVYFLRHPTGAVATLTIAMAVYFIASGFIECIAAFLEWAEPGSKRILINGIIALLLGSMMGRNFPFSGFWAIGILLGLKFISTGTILIGLGSAASRGVAAIQKTVGNIQQKEKEYVDVV